MENQLFPQENNLPIVGFPSLLQMWCLINLFLMEMKQVINN